MAQPKAAARPVVARLRAAGCVFAEAEAEILLDSATSSDHLEAMVLRRASGVPLEHVVGWVSFCGVRIGVDDGVFVPRRRTEALVREAVRLARPGDVVVDLCCGSGALGVAVATAVPGIELHAADVDPAAVRCARRNLVRVDGLAYLGDLDEPLPGRLAGAVGVLLANVPYVPSDEVGLLPSEAREHEARVALDGGPDGLDLLRRVASAAPRWLAPGGHVLVETSDRQAAAALDAFEADGLSARLVVDDDVGATVVVAQLPAAVRGRDVENESAGPRTAPDRPG